MRVTMTQLRSQAAQLDNAMGWPAGTTTIQEGSKTYGRAFRLSLVNRTTGAHMAHPFGDFIGMTKAEAHDALRHIINSVWVFTNEPKTGWLAYVSERMNEA